MLKEWKETFFNPSQFMPELAPKANLNDGLQHLIVGFIVAGTIGMIAFLISSFIFSVFDVTFVFYILIGFIISLVIGILFVLIASGVIWITAKVLGGKGNYGQQFHMISAPFAILIIFSSILSIIPIIGGLIAILLYFYYLYPLTVAVREAHKISTLKALLAWLLPLIIITYIVFVFVLFAFSFYTLLGWGRQRPSLY